MSDRTKVEPEKVKSFFDNEIRLNGISRSNSPLVIFITGVSGSGKSTIIDKIDLNALKIQPDNYRKTHPKIDLFVEKYGRDEAYRKTSKYSFKFAKSLRDLAIENRINVIYESTFSKIDTANDLLKPFIDNNYKIAVVQLPVDIELSIKRNIARYEEKKAQEHTIPRLSTREDIEKMANNYLATLDEIRKCGINVIAINSKEYSAFIGTSPDNRTPDANGHKIEA
ncbi:conserved hypothetical protein [Gallibacterium anatis UMN179]|uniref:Zeta toxin domain-containing protein n=1 Tax=Gallibacterium anatis (strain UMN179) TaxID=1005058 RepID=F4HFL2_GALAU|nr:zeta toxin family protein [Gallibacterium anatis]AEC17053.1 conserved hypothetical protein [Gallibacterium anatis UMN179]